MRTQVVNLSLCYKEAFTFTPRSKSEVLLAHGARAAFPADRVGSAAGQAMPMC